MKTELYELTNSQKNIWSTEQYYKGTNVNNICGTLYIKTSIDFKKLTEAVSMVIKTNDNFVLEMINKDEKIYQKLTPIKNYILEIVDVKNKTALSSLENAMCNQIFSIENNKLFDIKLFRCSNNYGGVVLSMHHLLADSWTFGLICKQIISNYKNLLNNTNVTQPTYSYIDHVKSEETYLKSDNFIKDKTYWNNLFSIIPEPVTIPSLKGTQKHNASCIAGRKLCNIPKDIVQKINIFCKENKISIYNFLMSIYSIYISEVSNTDHFIIGTPILNRLNFADKHTNGMFISTVPLYIQVQNSDSFINLSKTIAQNSMSMLRHQRYPYQNILEDLRKKDASIPNLYNIILSYQITKTLDDEIPSETHWVFNGNSADDLQIHIVDYNNTGSLDILYDYRKSMYTKTEITNLHNRIYHIIEQVLNNPKISVNDIEIVTEKEKHQLLYEFNNTNVEYPKDKTIVDLFEEQVEKTPDNIALIFENKRLTYKELNEKANQLARYLMENGIKNGDIVGIMLHRSIEMIIGLLAISKVGAAYLPIDPEYPIDRILYILKDSQCTTILVHSKTLNLLDTNNCNLINIDLSSDYIYSDINLYNLNIPISPNSLVYLIYTSGSTGNPKGVMIKHQNLCNFVFAEKKLINFSKEKKLISVTTICFDIFALELWCSLSSGMQLILANDLEQNSPQLLSNLCLNYNVNMIQTTPSRYFALLSDPKNIEFFKNFTDIMVGGEALPKKLLEKLHKITNANIFNMYGPTETTVWSTFKDLTKTNNISIGKPISNTTCYILNKNKKILPCKIPGELYIGGDGVTNGYLGKQELTNSKFINSPFTNNDIIYNTNDLAYFENNGEIIHLGRTDFQIKLKGYRIDLDEIQEKLLSIADIENAVIIPKDNKFLICYYVSSKEYLPEELSSYLLKYLPNYMIPSYFVKISSIPLTPNGKIDRINLLNIKLEKQTLQRPTTNTEKIICNEISKMLHSKKIYTNVSFLDLGLDSLGIIQLQTNLLKYGYTLSTQDFYEYSNVKVLAKMIDKNINIEHIEETIEVPKQLLHTQYNTKNNILHINPLENILNNVLLTGANGFVGIHILRELLKTTKDKIYCLIRGENYQKSLDKLCSSYNFYFNESLDLFINYRVFIVNGDITDPNFIINAPLKLYTNDFSTIIHTVAIVKHYGKFDDFNKVNVLGTKNILEFAYKNNKRFIHISSISVSGNYLVKQDNSNVDFDENSLYIGQHYNDNVYVHSKIEAEKLVYSYIKKGLVAQIHRLGIIAGRFSDGVFQKKISENAFYSRIKSMILLGAVSNSMLKQHIEFTPVDSCATAIVALSKNSYCNNKVFNLYNHHLLTLADIVSVFDEFNISMKILNELDFNNYINSATKNNNIALQSIINDINYNSDNLLGLNYNFTVNIRSLYTQQYLNALNFDWPIIDKNYMRRLVAYMKKVNFI